MKTSRTVLNELKWRNDRDFARVEVEYIHRGGPDDLATVSGADIISLEAWMMVIRKKEVLEQLPGRRLVTAVPGEAAIPYHRITRVIYDGKTVFDRASGRDLIDDTAAPLDTPSSARVGEDEGIYPEPPKMGDRQQKPAGSSRMDDKEPNVVDADDDDVSAADFRDMDEGAEKAPVQKSPPKKAPIRQKPVKAHPSKMVKKSSGRKAKGK
jgi:uncharacterized protein (UPF0248 family)